MKIPLLSFLCPLNNVIAWLRHARAIAHFISNDIGDVLCYRTLLISRADIVELDNFFPCSPRREASYLLRLQRSKE